MARPVYPYELGDPDFAWLLATYQESHPNRILVDSGCLPLVLIDAPPSVASAEPADSEQTVEDEPKPFAKN